MGFFSDIFNKLLFEALRHWGELLVNMGEVLFFVERSVDDVLKTEIINNLYTFISGFAVSLILLKMLMKGFSIYVLWRDGDPDAPVQQMVVNLAIAVCLTISFPTIYEWYADINLWLIQKTISMSFESMHVFQLTDMPLAAIAESLVFTIIALIYIIMMFVLFLQFFKHGMEMLILRLGFPLACLGLLDSDNGVFASTVKVFIQVSLTSIVQLFLMNLSAVIFVNSQMGLLQLLFCISCCMAAFGIPRLLQFITLPQGGGGGMYKVTSTMHMASMVKGFLPR